MKQSNKYTQRKTIGGIEITYEFEEGKSFAVGYCPNNCGHKEESIGLSLDPGIVTAKKIQAHLKKCPNQK